MADYIINYTNPLKGSFIIKPYTSNGNRFPTTNVRNSTSATANTPLLLFGKGHPEYGERTDENLFHMLEHFSGPSAPIIDVFENTIAGTLWHADIVYFMDTTGSPDWYQWNGSSWTDITSQVQGPGQPASPNNGDIWYDGTYLYRYSDDERGISSWIKVEFDEGAGNPNSTSPARTPTRELRINHDGTSSGWVALPDLLTVNGLIDDLSDVYVNETGDTMSGSLTIGTVSTPQLVLSDTTDTWNFDATSTFNISDASSGRGISIDPTGVINILNYGGSPSIYASNLTSASDDAIPNKAYVDGLVAGSISGDKYVRQLGSSFSSGVLTLGTTATHPDPSIVIDTFTADQITFGAGSPLPDGSPLTINIGSVATTEVQTALNELESQKASLTEDETFTGNVSFSGTVTGNDPTSSSELATKDYVDTQLVTAGPYERYIITGTTDTILLPEFPNGLSYTSDEYRLMVFKNGVKLYAHDASGSPIVEYGYAEILVTPVAIGSPIGSPETIGTGSPIVVVDKTGTSSGANGIQLATPPLITDVFEFILT